VASHRLSFDDIAGLAAARAALDPDRHYWRSDILISSIIEILSTRALSERELLKHVKKLMLTSAVNLNELRDGLACAEKALLIEHRGSGRDVRWTVTPESARDAKDDRDAAKEIIIRLEKDLRNRLDELLEGQEEISQERAGRLARYLIGAYMSASQRVFDGVLRAADPLSLDAIDFELAAVDLYLREHVRPPSVATELIHLARAAFDPTDDFGTEILHLIVTGRVLQGMIARHDLPGPSLVSGSLLLLDTSALVYRLEPTGPHPQILEEVLVASRQAGCDVVVTRAVIDEWERLWRAADKEAPSLVNPATGLPSLSWRLRGNPVLRSWLLKSEAGQPQTWSQFKKHNEQIGVWLTRHDVRIIKDSDTNSEIVERMQTELMRLSDAAANQLRSAATARTDAVSAALVAEARYRDPAPVPRSWFIAQDRLTNKAYAAVQPDDRFPVAATVEAWLLLLSSTRPRDSAEVCDLAKLVGESVVLNSFLAISAGFGIADAEEIVELLTQESSEDPEDLAEDLRTDFLAQAYSDTADGPAKLLRHRALRRERRVRTMVAEAAAAQEKGADQEAQKDHLDSGGGQVADLERSRQRWRRGCGLVGSLAVIALGIVLSAFLWAPVWVVAGAAVGWVAIGCEGSRWLRDPNVKALGFLLALGATIAWAVLGSIIGVALSQSATAHPTTPTVKPSAASVPLTRQSRSFLN
jgi:hypothetical protein